MGRNFCFWQNNRLDIQRTPLGTKHIKILEAILIKLLFVFCGFFLFFGVFFLAVPHGLQDLSSLTRNRTGPGHSSESPES